MPNCTPSTLVISQPTQDTVQSMTSTVVGTCGGSTSPFACCDVRGGIGPRLKRDKVREKLHDAILLSLGAPVLKIELDKQNIDYAIDYALRVFEDYAPREFYNYYTFLTQPGKSVYEMPPEIGIIRNVFYRKQPIFNFQASDLDGAIPVEYFYPGGAYASIQGGMIDPVQPIWGRAGEWALYSSYQNMYQRLSSGVGGWEWVNGYRHIKLYPIPCGAQHVIVHYLQNCKDWECITQAMVEGAVAQAKIMLGRIRGKYTNIPGVQGGLQLDGATLLEEGNREWTEWQERLINRYGDILPITMD